MIQFTIPGAPVGKGRPRMTRSGHAYTPAQTRNREAYVKLLATEAMAGAPPLDGPVSVAVEIRCAVPASWPKGRRAEALVGRIRPGKPDLDNVLKLVLDAMNGVVVLDDKQVAEAAAMKRYDVLPETQVCVEPLPK